MQKHTRIRIQDAADFIREEGGCNEIIALGLQKIVEALNDEMDDEELMIPDDSDDIVVDRPEPKEEQETGNKEGKRRREKKEEQETGNKEGKRRRRKQEAAEPVTADSPSSDLSDRSVPSGSPSPSRVPALTPEQIRQGQSRVLRLIQQRTPPDIPTLVRACIDAGFTEKDLAALTGLSCHMIARCKTGAVTLTVADRFQELFAFPRKPVAQEEA